jgi:hypothetical protein
LAIGFAIDLFLGEPVIHNNSDAFVLLQIAGTCRNGGLLMSKCNAIYVFANLETVASYPLKEWI